ncbi:polysaccharide export protein EpsE [Curvibacter sp. APW13]|uniref:polysaccharide export protein EpsE n=1 Tax=Curvibacter sp. APW13 TaxID=3077236 RepID=UPI0028DF21C8|nr:polysaccharide export protein EpsE [Curvibacter sp. APW13]MDT8992587.1 polysaccharide export protein EpsE [Curvibacter sp. APW13]
MNFFKFPQLSHMLVPGAVTLILAVGGGLAHAQESVVAGTRSIVDASSPSTTAENGSPIAETMSGHPMYVDYLLSAGDSIRIQVYQNPDLTIETRVSENGVITYPLVGALYVGGRSLASAENVIAQSLKAGGYLQKPQVNITLLLARGNQVSVLGLVARPGRFSLDTVNTRLSDILASAGGTLGGGDDVAIVTGLRDGKAFRQQVDIPSIFIDANHSSDLVLQGGDSIYVHRAPVFYIYGEAQRSGSYRIERDMTIMQALAQGGGVTSRGSENRLRLHRRFSDGRVLQIDPKLTDLVLPNDVLFVKESMF